MLNESNSASLSNSLGVVTSLGYNLCGDSGGGFLTNATDQINIDPLLGPLQDNGGPTFTSAPLPGSPAIDKGKNLSGAATDQRGFSRTFDKAAIANAAGGDGTDIGAVESQSYTVVNTNDSGAGSLRQAIADSNAQPGTNTIDFAPSAYGTIPLTSGELLITNSVCLTGPGASNEILDPHFLTHAFHIRSNNIVLIAGLTVTNGYARGTVPEDEGGAVYNDHSNLIVSNANLSGNRANHDGGAITVIGSSSTNSTELHVINSTLSDNFAGFGGAIYTYDTSGKANIEIRASTLASNTASSGGAVQIANIAGLATLQVFDSTFTGNSGADGNDIYCTGGNGNANLGLFNSTLVGNGLSTHLSYGTNTLQMGSTILSYASSGSLYIEHNSNIGTNDFLTLGYNLCSDAATNDQARLVLTNSTDLFCVDPMLGPLQDNGGLTFTHAPLPGSPTIEAGKNFSAVATDQRGFARTIDIGGVPNALGGDGTDIGAVESQDASLRMVNAGVISNQFGFNLVGPFANVVVEASTNVSGSNWTALATNTLGDAPLRITDPNAPNFPKRFYRARVN